MQHEILELMRQRQLEQKWEQHVHVLPKWFSITRLKYPVVLGSWAWASKAIGVRWIIQHGLTNIGVGDMTWADVARIYLGVKYPKWRGRVTSAQYQEVVKKHRSVPQYAVPCQMNDAVYLDLKSAYWQIISSLGWDVDYYPARWLAKKSDNADFPFSHWKLSRNSLASVGLNGNMQMWTGQKLVTVHKNNPTQNMVLWAAICDVLHGIASDMIEHCGAVYVNTDGYIIPKDTLPYAHQVMKEWGVWMETKASGPAVVNGIGEYAVGGHVTLNFTNKPKRMLNKVEHGGKGWLRKRFRTFSYMHNLILTGVS